MEKNGIGKRDSVHSKIIKLLHELLGIYLEKIVLYQLVTSTKNQNLNELLYKFGSVYTEILVNILPLLW